MGEVSTGIGLILSLVGVILLFRYGMPFRVASEKGEFIITESIRPEEARLNSRYKSIGFIGLLSIIIGTLLQIIPLLMVTH